MNSINKLKVNIIEGNLTPREMNSLSGGADWSPCNVGDLTYDQVMLLGPNRTDHFDLLYAPWGMGLDPNAGPLDNY